MNNWNPYSDPSYGRANANGGAQPGYDFSQMPQNNSMGYQQQRPQNQPNRFNVQPTPPEGPKMADYFGKIVDDANDIKYSDVPKDGQPAIFPLRDLSGIIVRSCNDFGTIDEAVYVKREQQPATQAPDPLQAIYSKLEQLEVKINALSVPVATPEPTQEPKTKSTKGKGVVTDE